ncbi:methyltransferase domain-containing protein [Phormidium sp. CLA17]|uniref:SAM-dependent methyltransferase n=1 Tax=Leptolyngbya sp. Cla-17 TaxID=2803751 RepID=UPI00149240F1|nr:SAM-dependent methyltransferase [Leptolyngbya sp. Cla-17]MBM0743432.1 methyltransferase domain-containing protein [Leptolyngbya sp. Cla-17]
MDLPQKQTLTPDYFDALYSLDPDPWKFETSEYEAQKYAATLAALSKDHYQSALEIGTSIGVLTEMLAGRCTSLLSIDVSEIAQQQAITRCQSLLNIRFQLMCVPKAYPNEQFDLTVLSEVGYYWCREDLEKAQQLMLQHLEPGGHLLLVHWTPYDDDYHNPLSGDEVHESFLALPSSQLKHLKGDRADKYRLDLFERVDDEST